MSMIPKENTHATDQLAEEAVREIEEGMVIGLGTGRAASRAIRALAAKVKTEGFTAIRCVATSDRSAELARSLGLTVLEMRVVAWVDLLFDGVDELDPNLAMTKGGGGAMTREKIVAEAATRRFYLMQQSKVVSQLGEHASLPIEVLEFAMASVKRRLDKEFGLASETRFEMSESRRMVRTDDGNLILDCIYGEAARGELRVLDHALNSIPGVVGHGLFVDQADVVLIEDDEGKGRPLERRERSS